MIRIITCTNAKAKNAGPKAKEDIIKILKKKYGKNIVTKTLYEKSKYNRIEKVLNIIKKIIFIIFNCYFNNDRIIIQYPMSSQFELLSLFPKKRTIVVVHDLQGLRLLNCKKNRKEIRKLKKFSYIVAHNEYMKKYMTENGIEPEKVYLIEIFDYLVADSTTPKNKPDGGIAFVGNLSKEKSPFIHQLDTKQMNFKLYLYGVGVNDNINDNVIYNGAYNPDELPNFINQKYGLVWDGNFDDSDENVSYKNYTKYNNPHKISCYLAAGIPVIVWEKAAIADFVKKNNIGYTINSIYDINNLDTHDYLEKKKNVLLISKRIKQGYYTNKVFNQIMK